MNEEHFYECHPWQCNWEEFITDNDITVLYHGTKDDIRYHFRWPFRLYYGGKYYNPYYAAEMITNGVFDDGGPVPDDFVKKIRPQLINDLRAYAYLLNNEQYFDRCCEVILASE